MNSSYFVALLYAAIGISYGVVAVSTASIFLFIISLVWLVCAGVWVHIGQLRNRTKASQRRLNELYGERGTHK